MGGVADLHPYCTEHDQPLEWCAHYVLLRDQMKRDVLAAYGVTFEEVEALDAAFGGPQLRERQRRLEAALPGRIAEITAEINERYKDVLPEGVRFEWDAAPISFGVSEWSDGRQEWWPS